MIFSGFFHRFRGIIPIFTIYLYLAMGKIAIKFKTSVKKVIVKNIQSFQSLTHPFPL
jgi:hypothetical protein